MYPLDIYNALKLLKGACVCGLVLESRAASEMMYAATLGKSQRVRLLRTVKLKAVILQPLWKTQDFCAEALGYCASLPLKQMATGNSSNEMNSAFHGETPDWEVAEHNKYFR